MPELAPGGVAEAVSLGEYFAKKKIEKGHGKFLSWLVTNFPINRKTASNLMAAYHQQELVVREVQMGNVTHLRGVYAHASKANRLEKASAKKTPKTVKLPVPLAAHQPQSLPTDNVNEAVEPMSPTHLPAIILGIILLTVPHRRGHWPSQRFLPASQVFEWIGTTLLIAGLVFTVWARVHLGANWSGIVTLKKDHELIRSGPYRWVRHPIYTGLLLALFGSAIALGEWHELLGVVFITVGFILKLRLEEHWLGEIFGEQYARYQAEVPALLPKFFDHLS
jgi:protein-S-isoprenylcysteine O-methyltransferase Ste14